MQAGEVYIDIAARVDKMDAALKSVETKATSTAKSAGGKFGIDFGGEFGNKAGEIAKQFAGPMMAAQLAKAAAGVLRSEKALPDAILDGLKTIPFVGAFVDLGSAIYDATFGAADKAADDLVKKQENARESMRQGASRRQEFEREAQTQQASLMIENRKLELAREVLAVKAGGDEKATAVAEAERKAAELTLQHNLDRAKTEDEKVRELMDERHARQLEMLETELSLQLDKIAEAEKKQEQADAKSAQDAADRIKREKEAIASREQAARDAATAAAIELDFKRASVDADAEGIATAERERDKRLRALEKEKALRGAQTEEERRAIEERFDLEEQSAAIVARQAEEMKQALSPSSVATALGSFTFDPYPASKQKEVQERTMRATERTAEKLQAAGVY